MIHYLPGSTRIVCGAMWLLAFVILCLLTIWAAAALYFDLPATNLSLPVTIFYLVVVVAVLFFFKVKWVSLAICFALFAGVVLWWWSIQPSNNRDWQPGVAETAWTERDGDKITIHNLRNFDYEPGKPATPRWETKVVDLSQLGGVDLYINFWGSTLICHPIVSFQFGPNDHVAISVETRMAQGQTYSTVRGFFKQFELIYIVADERDVIRVRTNYRHEQLYLYRTSVKPERARRLFLKYLETVNAMHMRPQFYNALTDNCTTNVRMHTAATTTKPAAWDWRMLLNGTVDQLVYENGGFASHLPFTELKEMSLIDAKAEAADQAANFSTLIRAGLPGFDQ
jgi:Ca2+/Na+ antiporter